MKFLDEYIREKFRIILFIFLMLPFSLHSQELDLYSLISYERSSGITINFTSLTDSYRYSDHPDSIVISEEYLGNRNIYESNYHLLNNKYRARFLKHMGIDETDKVFIYEFFMDTIISFRVVDLQLVALLDPYTHADPYTHKAQLSPFYYQIGFDFDRLSIARQGGYYSTLVYIGKNNPFQSGNIQPILWEEVDRLMFPANVNEVENANWFKNYKREKTFKYTTDNLDYYIQNMSDSINGARHMVVVESYTGKVVFNKIYYEGEGLTLTPLTTNDLSYYVQWTGKIFKGKPSIVYGLNSHSFGCPIIDFLVGNEKFIEVRCDNRH